MAKVSIIIPSRNEQFLPQTVDETLCGSIYLITNRVNGKQYVGQTTRGINRRWAEHLNEAARELGYPICRAIRKHGGYSFEVEKIAEAASLDQLNELESFYIETYDTIKPNGYNLDSGGGNFTRHPDTGKKISKAKKGSIPWNKGVAMSDATKLKISEAKKGKPSPRKGVKMSEQSRQKLSKSKMGQAPWNKGRSTPAETRAKISAAMKGKLGTPHTAEFKTRMSMSLAGNKRAKGCKRSDEYKAHKRALAQKRQRDTKGRFVKDG